MTYPLMQLVIGPGGDARCVYGEAIELPALGRLRIYRASVVEADAAARWWADLSPVGGPTLGPFRKRSAALAAEGRWLADHRLAAPGPPETAVAAAEVP